MYATPVWGAPGAAHCSRLSLLQVLQVVQPPGSSSTGADSLSGGKLSSGSSTAGVGSNSGTRQRTADGKLVVGHMEVRAPHLSGACRPVEGMALTRWFLMIPSEPPSAESCLLDLRHTALHSFGSNLGWTERPCPDPGLLHRGTVPERPYSRAWRRPFRHPSPPACQQAAICLVSRVSCIENFMFHPICCAVALQIGSRILGYGSGGTLVFEGELDGRPVAIKRILHQFYDLAKKEIGALILSDEVSTLASERAGHAVSRCTGQTPLHRLVCTFSAAAWSLGLIGTGQHT